MLQYYGWATEKNRAALMPTLEQIEQGQPRGRGKRKRG